MSSGYMDLHMEEEVNDDFQNEMELPETYAVDIYDGDEETFFEVIEHERWYQRVFRRRTLMWLVPCLACLCWWYWWNSITWVQVGSISLDETSDLSTGANLVLSSDGRTLVLMMGHAAWQNNTKDSTMTKNETGRVRIWRLSSSERWILEHDTENVGSDYLGNASAVSLSGDGSLLVLLGHSSQNQQDLNVLQRDNENGYGKKWTKTRQEEDAKPYQHERMGNAMALSQDGTRLVLETIDAEDMADRSVRVAERNTNDDTWKLVGNELQSDVTDKSELLVTKLAISGAGNRIAVGSQDGINVYELDGGTTWNLIQHIDSNYQNESLNFDREHFSVAMSTEGRRVAFSCGSVAKGETVIRTYVLVQDEEGEWATLGKPIDSEDTSHFDMSFSGDGKVLAVADSNAVRVFRLGHGKWLRYGRDIVSSINNAKITDISVSLDYNGNRIGVASSAFGENNFVSVYEL